MFMRLVQLKVRPHSISQMKSSYEKEIVPELEKVDGCRFASLAQNATQPDEFISLTLWESPDAADRYVRDGTYARLLDKVTAYFATATEWKVQLTADQTLEYVETVEEPEVKAYHVSSIPQLSPPAENPETLYVRVLSLRFKSGKMDEFKRIYQSKILPLLQITKGCRYACLTENANDEDEAISMTIWNSKSDADEYELNGTFFSLLHDVGYLLSELYQWKMALGREPGRKTVSSEDLSVKGFSVVTGRSFI